MAEEEIYTGPTEGKIPPKEPKKKTSSRIKYWINILIVFVLTVVALVISLSGNINEVFAILGGCNWAWLGLMLGLMVFTVFIRAIILFFFARLYTKDYTFHQAMAVEEIGVFYSAVTPGATGGQVMEAYVYSKQGLHVSNAISMLAMYSIIYQVVLILYGLIAFVVKFDSLNSIGYVSITLGAMNMQISIWLLTVIGFILNLSVILLVFLMSYWRGFHKFIMGPCVSLCYKMHIVKEPTKTRENLRVQVENFKIELKRLLTNIPFTILIFVLFFIFFTLRFSLPYFAGFALHNESNNASFWDAVLLSNYHQMVTGLIPIPGSAGVSEYFFAQLFVDYNHPENGFYLIKVIDEATGLLNLEKTQEASRDLCSAALLLWRTISFTLPLIVAGAVTAFYHAAPKDVEKTSEMPSRQTYINNMEETLLNRKLEVDKASGTMFLSKEAIAKRLRERKKEANASKDEKVASKRNTRSHLLFRKTKSSHNKNEEGFESIDIKSDDED